MSASTVPSFQSLFISCYLAIFGYSQGLGHHASVSGKTSNIYLFICWICMPLFPVNQAPSKLGISSILWEMAKNADSYKVFSRTSVDFIAFNTCHTYGITYILIGQKFLWGTSEFRMEPNVRLEIAAHCQSVNK